LLDLRILQKRYSYIAAVFAAALLVILGVAVLWSGVLDDHTELAIRDVGRQFLLSGQVDERGAGPLNIMDVKEELNRLANTYNLSPREAREVVTVTASIRHVTQQQRRIINDYVAATATISPDFYKTADATAKAFGGGRL
jgi:hypothetical protein